MDQGSIAIQRVLSMELCCLYEQIYLRLVREEGPQILVEEALLAARDLVEVSALLQVRLLHRIFLVLVVLAVLPSRVLLAHLQGFLIEVLELVLEAGVEEPLPCGSRFHLLLVEVQPAKLVAVVYNPQ